jgi:hypothetical protein
VSRKLKRTCGEIRKIIWAIQDAWRVAASRHLMAPECKIKRRGKIVWLHIGFNLPDSARFRTIRKLSDDGGLLRLGEGPGVWLTGECQKLTEECTNMCTVNQKSIRQQRLTIDGKFI